jgi:Fur family transcriptional regulator, ferric uptake regulator
MYDELETLFAQKALRLTTPRRVVFDALYTSKHPLLIGEIIKACSHTDRVSVYRTLELFTKLGVAEIIPMGWKQRYELTSPFKPHHHHLYCSHCGALIDVHSQKLELLVAAIAREYEFMPVEHKFEVSGTCKACQRLS